MSKITGEKNADMAAIKIKSRTEFTYSRLECDVLSG